jgi:putative pyruvate formate lyase activating enzyme
VGTCGIGRDARLASLGPHFGEEAPLVGRRGSGTLFLTGCNLRCRFCQNASLSQLGEGRELPARALADAMLSLQEEHRCENLNLVTPSHVCAQLLEALALAVEDGLALPIVYNCGGYESLEALALWDGVVDLYLPDLKFADAEVGLALAGVPDYPEVARAAIREMHRQVGALVCDEEGVARRGLLVRHLVLPAGRAGSAASFAFLADLSRSTYLNVMGQYRPCHLVHDDPVLGRRLTPRELEEALALARAAGLARLDGA